MFPRPRYAAASTVRFNGNRERRNPIMNCGWVQFVTQHDPPVACLYGVPAMETLILLAYQKISGMRHRIVPAQGHSAPD